MTEHERKMVFELEKLCAEIKGGKYHSRGYFLVFVEPATDEHPNEIIVERDDGLAYLELLGVLASCSGTRSADAIEHDPRYDEPVPAPEPDGGPSGDTGVSVPALSPKDFYQ